MILVIYVLNDTYTIWLNFLDIFNILYNLLVLYQLLQLNNRKIRTP